MIVIKYILFDVDIAKFILSGNIYLCLLFTQDYFNNEISTIHDEKI